MKKERNLRKRKPQQDKPVGDDDSISSCVEGIKAMQKRRLKKIPQESTGSLKAEKDKHVDEKDVLDAYVKETSMKTTSETQEMDRYIEYHMKQRLGCSQEKESKNLTPAEQRDMELFEVPDNLKAGGAQEVSIPGLMTGISEVQLPMSCRLKNIEDTEEAKAAILETGSLESLKRKKRRTPEQVEEEETGIKRSMFALSFGRARRQSRRL